MAKGFFIVSAMKRSLKILPILDPYPGYNFRKDTTHLLLLQFAQKGHQIFYADPASLYFDKTAQVAARRCKIHPEEPYFSFEEAQTVPLTDFDLILMRKDPPVDASYLHAAQILATVEAKIWIINRPASLIQYNEKLITLLFPDLIPRTLVTSDGEKIARFIREVGGTAILKQLDSYASLGIHKIGPDLEEIPLPTMTDGGRIPLMVQECLQIERGEKRVFLIEGEPLGSLLRLPPTGGFLTSPDRGGVLQKTELTPHEREICTRLKPFLQQNGIFFAGIDVIQEKLTEINITSPGLLWELNEVDQTHYEERIVDQIEKKWG